MWTNPGISAILCGFFWYHCKLYWFACWSQPLKTHFIKHYSLLNRMSHIQADVNVTQSIYNVYYVRKAWHWSIKSLLNQPSGYRHWTFDFSRSTPPTHQGNLHCGWRRGWRSLHRGRAKLPPFYLLYGRCDVLHVKAKILTAWGRNEVNTQPD